MSLFKATSLRLSVVYDDTHPHRTRSNCQKKMEKCQQKKLVGQNKKELLHIDIEKKELDF